MKADIIAKTEHFAEAMESLNTEDVHAMQKDFNDVFAMYQDDLAEYTTSKKHASLAHASEGTAAMKKAIIAKTKQFAEAMESLNTEDVDAMKKDFNDVFALYKDDLEKTSEKPRDDEDDEDQDDQDEGADDFDDEDQDDTEHTASKKHASLAHSSEGTAAMKAEIIAKTKQFAEAMESLKTEDVHAMKMDFNDVFAMYQDDLAEYTASKKLVFLAHSSEGTAAMKAAIIAKTKQFAEAMES